MSSTNLAVRVAIIEKELITRLALSRCLRYDGMKVFYAEKLVEAIDENPDVIIVSQSATLDELHEIKRKYRSKGQFPLLIVISWSTLQELPASGFPDFIFMRKPIICNEITSIIRDALALAISR